MILFFDALIETAVMIAHNRKGSDSGKSSHAWLEWIDDENCLQFAMLTDTFDEVLAHLLRFHDHEAADPSEIACAVSSFVSAVMSLFKDGNVVHCGLTAMMLIHLQTPHTILLNGRTPKTIGSSAGVPQAIIDRCLTRMRTWLRLALDVIQA